jgi:hypothetical protein
MTFCLRKRRRKSREILSEKSDKGKSSIGDNSLKICKHKRGEGGGSSYTYEAKIPNFDCMTLTNHNQKPKILKEYVRILA